jgi:protein involved in polysaccharide export with SLBB domain
MIHLRLATIFLFAIAFLLATPNLSSAQFGMDSTDLSNIQSSDISDAQLRTAISRAEQQGLTIDQALQMAQARGLSSSVANQLRTRIRQLQMGGGMAESSGETATGEEYDIAREFERPERIETEEMRRTFGSQIFRFRETEFSPTLNMATPVNYRLGAGDELVIHIWGDQTNTYRLSVNPEGSVFIDNIGPIFVSGLTLEEANDRIIQQLEQLYSGLRGDGTEQTTFARVAIDRLRTIQVSMIGEVTNPGDYTIASNATVFNALYRGGGPGEDGSYRTIRVIRNNEIVAELDLYNYLVHGIQSGNIRLLDGDVIQVPPYDNRVEVKGEVKRSDLYFEVKEEETLSDLIRYAGDFSDQAYRRQLRIHRNTATDRRIVTVNQDEFDTFQLENGDVIYVDEILNRFENRVTIDGAVWRGGEFELTEGMTLSDLITEAEGLRPDAFRSRGLINRLNDDYSLEQISFNVSEVIENPEVHDVRLHREDQVLIRSIHELEDEQSVEISGAVRQPGEYNFRQSMTLEDLILKADGFTDAASEARIEVSRRILGEAAPEQRGEQLAEIFTFDVPRNLELAEQDRLFQLQPFDHVYIHRRPNYQVQQKVSIEGEVMYPGTYTIRNRNERISDLIERAGGLTNEAYVNGARLVRKHTAIDRPQIEFDFLSSEELLNEEQTGLSENENSGSDEANETGSEEINNGNIVQQRTELNTQDFRSSQNDSVRAAGTRASTESRIGIDLASILENPGSRDDLYLRQGDVLRIPQELQTVAISGAVMQDVEVRFQDGANLGYYVDRAGGFATNAKKDRVYVVYANGDVDRRKSYIFGLIKNSPSIEPGAHIIIPAKPEREGMDTGEIVSISAAIVSMTTSLIIALDRVAR